MDQFSNSPEVVVTGMGIVSAHGEGIPVFLQTLKNGLGHFKISTRFPMLSFPVIMAELENFHFDQALKKFSDLPYSLVDVCRKVGHRASLPIQTSLIAALEAWQQAQLFKRVVDRTRIGLVVAGQNITQAYQFNLYETFVQEPNYLLPSYALHFMDTDHVGTLSEAFNIQGEGFTVGGASASGNVAIIQASRLIQQGLLDVCLVVGVMADLSPMEIQGFYQIGALGGQSFQDKPNQACRPFDQRHEGFILGQAAACLVLESSSAVQKEDVPVLGKVIGMAMHLDANRYSDPSEIGEIMTMQQALTRAKLSASDIQYVNAHGSSSPLGDETEVTAIYKIFAQHVWLNSTKSIVGHCLWSAGIVEAIASLLQMQNSFVHANINLAQPINTECKFVGKQLEAVQSKYGLSNGFGFGGINATIILERGD